MADKQIRRADLIIVWDRKAVPEELYKKLVDAIRDLAIEHGASDLEHVSSETIGTFTGRFNTQGTKTGRLPAGGAPNAANGPSSKKPWPWESA